MRRLPGFSLIELLVAIGVLALALLSLLLVLTASLRAQRKAADHPQARLIAERELNRAVRELEVGGGPFWSEDYPYPTRCWRSGGTRAGPTTFQYAIYAETVLTAGSRRTRRLDAAVWWWGDAGQMRQGYGRLTVGAARLVSEPDEP